MGRFRNKMFIQFSVASFLIMVVLAVVITVVLGIRLNRNVELLKDHGAAMMAGTMIKEEDPFSIPSLQSDSRVPGSGVRGRGSGERETTASSLAGKEESSRKEDNSGQGKDGPAGAIAQGGNGR